MLVFKYQCFNKKHIGHNPLSGLMVIALILSLTLTCISGVMVYTSDGKRFYDFLEQPLLQDIDEHEQYLIEKVTGNVNEESD
jgi:cytochrome b